MPVWLTEPEYEVLRAACAQMLPSAEGIPGAEEAGVADYIDILLGAFRFDPPRIWAGGPTSGRTGGAARFDHFHTLSALDELAWRMRIEGSQGLPAREFNGPVVGLQETYRRGLAALPNPAGPPAAPPLPPELTARISAYRMHKLEVLRKLRAMLAAPTASPSRSSDGSLATGPLTWMHDGSTATEVPAGSLRVTVAEFDRVQTELIAALDREELSIRQALAAYVRSGNGHADRKSLNDLLRDFENARQQQELWDRYRDYHTAVLLPGLSPAQRQVLFEAGIDHLGLPLPVGEKPPVAREEGRP